MKVSIYLIVAVGLLLLGYSAGVLIQHQRMVRFNAARDLYHSVSLYRELVVRGRPEKVLDSIKAQFNSGVVFFHHQSQVSDLPRLLRGGAFDTSDAEWRDKAFAMAEGLHRVRPDFVSNAKARKELASYTPQTDVGRTLLKAIEGQLRSSEQ